MSKKQTKKQYTKKWVTIISVVLVLTLVVNVAANIFSGYADLYLGKGDVVITKAEGSEDWNSEYYVSDYATEKEADDAAAVLVAEIEAEGAVLLKNNGVLPLAAPADVTLLGRAAADPVYGGSGSGSVDLSSVSSLKSGLEDAGYSVNPEVYSVIEKYGASSNGTYTNPKTNIVMDDPASSIYYIGEMPVEDYEATKTTFSSYGDAAIINIGRGGGEGGDLQQDMTGWDDNYTEGQHQLELNQDEKDLIDLAVENFENVVVLINASSAMELDVLENNEGVDAVLWVGSPGQTGFNSVGQILNGTINPSGKTADIYPADFTKEPSFVNFGNYQYNNISKSNAMGDGYFVQYEEGIYVGYRYYETAAVEGFINYDEAVVYPFGYGLSYTNFEWNVTNQELGAENESITIDVEVTNTGSVAGKDVVEVYYSAPYTAGGIEKSSVVLADFAKTGLLEPGASETVQLTFAVEDMASYDYKTEKAYVLEEGNYAITVQTDSHNVKEGTEVINYEVGSTIVYNGDNHRASDLVEVTNQFDDVSAMFTDTATEGYALNFSRSDFAGTFPTAPTGADFTANDAIITDYQAYKAAENEDPEAVMPTLGASNGLNLIDLRGVDYDDESWDLLLDQLTVESMTKMILSGAYNTAAIAEVGKPATVDFDGPAGLSSFMTDISGTAFPSEVVIASTFNRDLAYKMGAMVANEGLHKGINGWYAPAMNIHRSQFAGRNFEYYSEDPYLSGVLSTYATEGAASKGMYTTIKHFALNDQESNRVNSGGLSTWANEQAIREIYLKPFEINIKNADQTLPYIADETGTIATKEMSGSTAVMSSFNRVGSVWSGGRESLQTQVLRNEWGFDGFVITDFNLYDYMYTNQGIAAGSDLMLTFDAMKTIEDSKSATAVSDLRQATKNILFTVANSNAMNGIAPGTIITYKTAPWQMGLWVADGIIAVLLIGACVMVSKKRSTLDDSISE
ncbi:MAG: glycoside hydrolase family 3 C-terminal domain-containing protein [Lachnospirales bacterium]